jgi:hypothetical protein
MPATRHASRRQRVETSGSTHFQQGAPIFRLPEDVLLHILSMGGGRQVFAQRRTSKAWMAALSKVVGRRQDNYLAATARKTKFIPASCARYIQRLQVDFRGYTRKTTISLDEITSKFATLVMLGIHSLYTPRVVDLPQAKALKRVVLQHCTVRRLLLGNVENLRLIHVDSEYACTLPHGIRCPVKSIYMSASLTSVDVDSFNRLSELRLFRGAIFFNARLSGTWPNLRSFHLELQPDKRVVRHSMELEISLVALLSGAPLLRFLVVEAPAEDPTAMLAIVTRSIEQIRPAMVQVYTESEGKVHSLLRHCQDASMDQELALMCSVDRVCPVPGLCPH